MVFGIAKTLKEATVSRILTRVTPLLFNKINRGKLADGLRGLANHPEAEKITGALFECRIIQNKHAGVKLDKIRHYHLSLVLNSDLLEEMYRYFSRHLSRSEAVLAVLEPFVKNVPEKGSIGHSAGRYLNKGFDEAYRIARTISNFAIEQLDIPTKDRIENFVLQQLLESGPAGETRIIRELLFQEQAKAEFYNKILNRMIASILKTEPAAQAETLRYRARKIADYCWRNITFAASIVAPLNDETTLAALNSIKDDAELPLGFINAVKTLLDHARTMKGESFYFDFNNPDSVQNAWVQIINGCRHREAFHLLLLEKLLYARSAKSIADPIYNEMKYLLIPMAEKDQLILMADDFRDQCLKLEDPGKYSEIEAILKDLFGIDYPDLKKLLGFFVEKELYAIFPDSLSIMIKQRLKSHYSIFEKIQRRGCAIEDLDDILAVTIVAENTRKCRDTIKILNSRIALAKPGEDHLDRPKENGWQGWKAVFTTKVPGNEKAVKIEIQVMTPTMLQINTEGKASHWKYKLEMELKTKRAELEKMGRPTVAQNFDKLEKNLFIQFHL